MQKQKNYYVVRVIDTHTLNYVDIAFRTREQANEYYGSFKASDRPHTIYITMLIKLAFKTAVDFEIVHTFVFTNNLLDYSETMYDRADYLLSSKLVKGNYYEIAKQYSFDFVVQKKRFV